MTIPLPETAPVVIIGGGIIGVSTLYHLAKRGVPAVLIEHRKLACGTTWHAAGIVGQLRDSTAQTELGKYTARLFRELEVETGQATGYKPNGTINLALGDVRHEQLLRSHDNAVRMGIETQLLSIAELREKWPWIETTDVRSAFFVPSNGQVNPLDVTVAMSKAARANGAQVFEDTRVTDLLVKDGKVIGVETDRGVIATDKVLLAAGMWSNLFAKAKGVTVPLHATEHFYIVTEPVAGLPRTQPILNIAEERTYWKEDTGKLLIGAFEQRGKPYGEHGIPEDFEFDELPFDMEHVEANLEKMFERMPALGEMGIQTFFNGPESFTPDGRPYLGPTAEIKGLYAATGMNSNGILNSGGVGLTMAEWMIDGAPSRGMGPMLARRAHPFQSNTRYTRERAAESVGFHYGVSWVGRQIHSARGVRRVPLHERLSEAGATFAQRIGWEVPMYYDPEQKGWNEEPNLRRKDWAPHVQAECLGPAIAIAILMPATFAVEPIVGLILGILVPHLRALIREHEARRWPGPVGPDYEHSSQQGKDMAHVNTCTRSDRTVPPGGHSRSRSPTWVKHPEPSTNPPRRDNQADVVPARDGWHARARGKDEFFGRQRAESSNVVKVGLCAVAFDAPHPANSHACVRVAASLEPAGVTS